MIRKLILATVIGTMPIVAEAQTCTTYPYPLVNGANADATQVMADLAYVASCVSALIPTTSGSPSSPQGRLTLVSATPVMTSAQTGKTTIYYTPYNGAQIPLYNGTALVPTAFSEIQNLTTNGGAGGGPAAAAANSNYDLFVWNSSGTITLTRGPAWTSDTARGTGAGTSELQMVSGTYTNKNAITNGPGANLGTYVGTVRTDGNSQANWLPMPAATAGGAEAKLHIFNAYNRVPMSGLSQDNTSTTWSYATATWRSLNGSNSNRISYIDGLGELTLSADASLGNNSGSSHTLGINRDSTNATPVTISGMQTASQFASLSNHQTFLPALGYHYLQAMEADSAGAASTQYAFVAAFGSLPNVQFEYLSAVLMM